MCLNGEGGDVGCREPLQEEDMCNAKVKRPSKNYSKTIFFEAGMLFTFKFFWVLCTVHCAVLFFSAYCNCDSYQTLTLHPKLCSSSSSTNIYFGLNQPL